MATRSSCWRACRQLWGTHLRACKQFRPMNREMGYKYNSSNCEWWTRRLNKILGFDANRTGAKNMTEQMTDAKIARLFKLCDEIIAVRNTMPRPPAIGGEVDL